MRGNWQIAHSLTSGGLAIVMWDDGTPFFSFWIQLIVTIWDKLARATGKPVGTGFSHDCASECTEEETVHGETRNRLFCLFGWLWLLLPAPGEYHCTVHLLDGWMALSAGLPQTYNSKLQCPVDTVHFHAYIKIFTLSANIFQWVSESVIDSFRFRR